MKTFCIAGPVKENKHYLIEHRLNFAEIVELIQQEKYFILHAPRQSGKTTALYELEARLNRENKYCALYVNVEPAQAARSDYLKGLRTILSSLESAMRRSFGVDYASLAFFNQKRALELFSGNDLSDALQFWSEHEQKPIVLFIDEIDSLVGDTLISVLRQLRSGYPNRPAYFPQSVCLIGVRDVRDYRIWSDEERAIVLGGSAFNIKAESLVLHNFTKQQVRDLYEQHTHATGQKFTDEAIECAFDLTQGQPWLVNALAYQACFRDVKDRAQQITKEIIERSKEELIRRRDTHIDVLVDRLHEPRVRAIIDMIIAGETEAVQFPADDLQYVIDLGLLARDKKTLTIANPIYQEIIPRELMWAKQQTIQQESSWYLRTDGSLDMHKMLKEFALYYRQNADVWLPKFDYQEAAPHLLLMTYLQRIIHGGGTIHREYGLGRKRVDLFITWKSQRIVIEIKILRDAQTIPDGLKQTSAYMDLCGATEGNLVVFDRTIGKPWDEKIYEKTEQYQNKTIQLWGM